MTRKFKWFASTVAGDPLTGSLEIHPGRVTDESRILSAAWERSAFMATHAGADMRRLMRVVADA